MTEEFRRHLLATLARIDATLARIQEENTPIMIRIRADTTFSDTVVTFTAMECDSNG